jgi:hypothetical protein
VIVEQQQPEEIAHEEVKVDEKEPEKEDVVVQEEVATVVVEEPEVKVDQTEAVPE